MKVLTCLKHFSVAVPFRRDVQVSLVFRYVYVMCDHGRFLKLTKKIID